MAPDPHVPDTCLSYDWNPITTAASWVPFLGGLAGFVFAGIIVTLSVRTSGKAEAANALKLLFVAFFSLVVAAYLFATAAGEQTCPRAETEQAYTGAVLATAIVCMITSLSWLIVAYERHHDGVLSFLRKLIYFSLVLATVMLAVSATSYVDSIYQGTNHLTFNITIYIVTGLGLMISSIILVIRRNKVASTRQATWVNALALTSLSYLAIASIVTGVILSIPSKHWYPEPSHWFIYTTGWVVFVLPVAVLGVSLPAIARTPITPPQPSKSGWLGLIRRAQRRQS
ncbi:hypothetical protein [Spirillospora sp. CA-128828]|uniref:hypothetical protein n=1 Tax=Spirillospora sp. CA-128828 TaxID=3240033 RepID=UPI003D93E68D